MCLLGTVGLFALMDRLVMAAFQRRSGPYNIGWFGMTKRPNGTLTISR